MHFQENEPSGEPPYTDVLAREWASETCIWCSRQFRWKTAALIYEGLEWRYYYCYECRKWFKRHFRYRYAVAFVDDPRVIKLLVRHVESGKEILEAELNTVSWIKRKFSKASNFFQMFLP